MSFFLRQMTQSTINEIADAAWELWGRARVEHPQVVRPAKIPILFFGNYDKYRRSRFKVVTAGLNPSSGEFPNNELVRFPAARTLDDNSRPSITSYLESLSAYFRVDPYMRWFQSYERVLRGMDVSYYDAEAENVALHTDLCSPLATTPKWSALGGNLRAELAAEGGPLWHRLIEHLEPDVVILSIGRAHLDTITFDRADEWRPIYTVERENPYVVKACDFRLASRKKVIFIWGRAANLPFGTVPDSEKRAIGASVRELYERRSTDTQGVGGLAESTANSYEQRSSAPETAEIPRVAGLLGGARVLRRAVNSPLDAHELLLRGLPRRALTHLVDGLMILGRTPALHKAVGMSLRTLQRHKEAPGETLSLEQSGRIWKFAEVLAKTTVLFGSQEAAERWLEQPAIGLGRQRPLDLLATPAGTGIVEELLGRLEYGVYA